MKTNLKINVQYGINIIINFIIGWIIVSNLRILLPESLTNGNTPEIPPQPIADLILILIMIMIMGLVNLLITSMFNINFNSNQHINRGLKIINIIFIIIAILAMAGISSVFNEGTFSDITNELLLFSNVSNVVLLIVNWLMTIRTHDRVWNRWGTIFMILIIIMFWLNLWISPV